MKVDLILKGERLQIWHYDDSDTYYLHTNGRCIGVDRAQAEAFHEGLGAILRGETNHALTPDLVEVPREASARPVSDSVSRKPNAIPTLEDI